MLISIWINFDLPLSIYHPKLSVLIKKLIFLPDPCHIEPSLYSVSSLFLFPFPGRFISPFFERENLVIRVYFWLIERNDNETSESSFWRSLQTFFFHKIFNELEKKFKRNEWTRKTLEKCTFCLKSRVRTKLTVTTDQIMWDRETPSAQ